MSNLFTINSEADLGKGMSMECSDQISLSMDALDSIITAVGSGLAEGTYLSKSTLASLVYGMRGHLETIQALVEHAYRTGGES